MTVKVLTRAFGWKNLAAAGILVVTLMAAAFAARRQAPDAPGLSPGDAAVLQSGAFMRRVQDERGAPVLDVQLDAISKQLGSGVVLRRSLLRRLLEVAVPGDPEIESRPVADVLGKLSRVRVTSEGMALTVGRRVIRRALSQAIRAEGNVEQMTVGEVLDGLAGARLTSNGVAGLLDGDVTALVGSALQSAQRVVPFRDRLFARRLLMQQRWELVTRVVKDLRRNGFADADREVLYNEAHDRLVAQGERASIPLLDGYLQLEGELAAIQVGAATRAERIPLRWQARRKVFEPPVVALIFGRDEAMERYEVDRLALEADEALSPAEKAQRLQDRRQALKVELAAQGTYVGFADEAPLGRRVRGGRAPSGPAAEEGGTR